MEFKGVQDNTLRKLFTARTFRLNNGKVLIEFFDRQAAVVSSLDDFKKLEEATFVLNQVWNLKKNVSYRIPVTPEKAAEILRTEKLERLPFESPSPGDFSIYVYELTSGQLLYLEKSNERQWQTLYPDIKTLCSENSTISEQYYTSKGSEYEMKQLALGDPLEDFEPNEHMVYPSYLEAIVKSHGLTLFESNIYVSNFRSNLYQSKNGYFMLIDEVNQKNGAGNKMPILTLRLYHAIEDVRAQQSQYERLTAEGYRSEHFYQKISDKYGRNFPEHVRQLVNALPALLNFDEEQLSFDFDGLKIIDEAIKWNATNYALFDKWFPSALAYFGEFYIKNRKRGSWNATFDSEHKVWIPEVLLPDGTPAFDSSDFYKSMIEGPIPMEWRLRY
jgi:hypothetical protein